MNKIENKKQLEDAKWGKLAMILMLILGIFLMGIMAFFWVGIVIPAKIIWAHWITGGLLVGLGLYLWIVIRFIRKRGKAIKEYENSQQ